MGVPDTSSPHAAVALLPRAPSNASHEFTAHLSSWPFPPARRALLLSRRGPSEVDSGGLGSTVVGWFCRYHLSQTADIRHSRRSPAPLACRGNRLFCISHGV